MGGRAARVRLVRAPLASFFFVLAVCYYIFCMSEKYTPTIGLEIHAELKTRTKMFCNSKNDPDETRPNVNVCPVCIAHPGTLPVINKEAVKHVFRVGVAIGGTCADFTEFDRKNYFYPDIPKGYQLSQYKYPLVSGGILNGVAVTRVHLEEDTATSLHEKGDYSLVDFNRAGVPLMELVTEPVIHGGKEAVDFARELQLLLRYLGASEANMEKGEMRVEANISVNQESGIKNQELGTKVEVKNLNSFRAVERAIAYETERQIALLEAGDKVVQETRGWDENTGTTFSQRRKEESHDYRYFPDPDLPKLMLSEIPEFSADVLRKGFPELPSEKRKRYLEVYKLKAEYAELFVQDGFYGALFEGVAKKVPKHDQELISLAGNYIASDLIGLLKANTGSRALVCGEHFHSSFLKLMQMIKDSVVSSRGAKDILAILCVEGGDPEVIAVHEGLLQKSNESELTDVVQKIISDHRSAVDEYKKGKDAALQFLVGQGMKATKGSANPAMLAKIFKEVLGQ